jgi:hypothetical protein
MPSETPSGTPSDDVYDYAGELTYSLGRVDHAVEIDPRTRTKVRASLSYVAATGAGQGRQAKHARHLLEI